MQQKEVYLKNLRPVGEFLADHEKRTIEVQPNAIRNLNESLIKEGGHQVDLHHGFAEFVERTEFKNKLFPMLSFLKIAEQTYGEIALPEVGEITSTRKTLIQIASSAYAGENQDPSFDDGFLVVLFKRNNRYYCCEYSTPSKKAKSTGKSKKLYAGIKFENYMTLAQNERNPNLDQVGSSVVAYNAVFKSTLVDKTNNATHNFLYPAKVDSIDKDGNYTEIKFRNYAIGSGVSWWRIEMNWILEAFFTKTQRIIVGFSDGGKRVSSVKEISPDKLHSDKGNRWELEGCLVYLSKFFTDAKKRLDEKPDNSYHYAVREPNSTEYLINTYLSQ